MKKFFPVAAPDLSGKEALYVQDAINSTWISSTGKYLDRFEKEFAAKCGANYCLAVSNGTVALHLALMGLDVKPGDEVIVPSFTYIASVNAIHYCGATPVFVDIDPNNWTVSPSAIEKVISARTKGIIAVHLYGHPADMDAVNEVASKHSLWVVEDAAEAHFASYKDRTVGALADVATFSFYGNKIMTCGEGGAVVFSNGKMKQRLQMLRGQGMDPQRRYFFPIVGYNYRLTNVAAALLCAQLERIDDIQSRRNQIYDWYNNELKEIPNIKLQPTSSWATVAPWLYCISVADDNRGIDANHLAAALAEKGIDSRPFFIPVHSMPPYEQTYQTRRSPMTVTDRVSRSGLNIPTYLGMTKDDVIYISQSIREIFRSQG